MIVRPHPGNIEPWAAADVPDTHTVIYPKSYPAGSLLSDAEVDAFWYSLVASSAVVGINTTAMIEAAIARRPVFSVRDATFAHSQRQTLHFDYLSSAQGGFTSVADNLSEHITQLEHVFSEQGPDLRASDRFVERFVRPLGMGTRATVHVCDAIQRVAGLGPIWRAPSEPAAEDLSVAR